MLKRSSRLNLKKDFSWVASGQRLVNPQVKIFFRFGQNESPRVGIATSKAVFKKATERNRARRLISSAFERLLAGLPKGVNIVVLPKESVVSKSSDEITSSLEELLKKEGLIQ